ncbi:hypothetical protein [Paenibacillus sp. Soil766]|nr:hypothetical protein [Paenibacillus sp. Soil766]
MGSIIISHKTHLNNRIKPDNMTPTPNIADWSSKGSLTDSVYDVI